VIKLDSDITMTRVAWAGDIIQTVADRLFGEVADPGDLSTVCLILGEGRAQNECRFRLAGHARDRGVNAMIGPQITTFEQLAAATPLSDCDIVPNSALQLTLLDALKEHDYLYGKASPLALANDLLQLFEQITRHDVQLPDNAEDLFHRIQHAYGSENNSQTLDSRFADRESKLIHHIWQALKSQLKDEGRIDSASAYAMQLELVAQKHRDWRFVYVGLEPIQSLEIHCLNLLAINNRVEIVTYVANQNDFYIDAVTALPRNREHERDNFYDLMLMPPAQQLSARKQQCLAQYPNSPIQEKVFIYACHNLEQEAQAIELQIRDWLQQKKKRIAFICNDRKLARRVRARLDRYRIHFNDKSGWSLSTSRSASIIERWLQCLETDFNYQAFLDLLKSPLLIKRDQVKAWMNAVYAFEKNIVFMEHINSGLNRYLNACHDILQKLPESLHAPYLYMIELLQNVQAAAQEFLPFVTGKHSPAHAIDALCDSLHRLGCIDQLRQDHVGEIVIDLLQQLKHSGAIAAVDCNWTEFRTWLGYHLEYARFNPPRQASAIQLLTLEQSDIQEFDACVIGGAEMEFLPGHTRASTFFNDTACRNLGLPDVKTLFTRSFHYFRRILGFSERQSQTLPLLICHRLFDKLEPVSLSPWVEALQTSHQLIYSSNLPALHIEQWMTQLAQQSRAQTQDNNAQTRAYATIDKALMPKYFSASAYQQLINCPYQYYAARALQLQVPESIKIYMEKSDYGNLVHRCLYAFHYGIKGIAKAFSGPINEANQHLAQAHLRQLSDKVFAEAIGENFIHRAWRRKWEHCIDPYIDWYKTQQQNWRPYLGETSVSLVTPHGVTLNSTIDRIDSAEKQLRILDYKTGSIPKNEDVQNGETVQLPFYALLLKKSEYAAGNDITQIAYLKLDDGDVRLFSPLEISQIGELCEKHQHRIDNLLKQITEGERLVAWGEQNVCRFCDYQGLCRREFTMSKEGDE